MRAHGSDFTNEPVNARSIVIATHGLAAATNSFFSFFVFNIRERCKFQYEKDASSNIKAGIVLLKCCVLSHQLHEKFCPVHQHG